MRLQMHGHVRVDSTKVRGLLGYLAYRANEFVHVDRISEALWDDDRPPDPAKTLQPYVSRLRRVFREAGCPADLDRDNKSYRLTTDPSIVDYHQLRTIVRKGHRARGGGQVREAAELFSAALRLWTGPPLTDLDTTWARRLRDTLTNQTLVPAHCALLDTKLALGDHDFVLEQLPPLLAEHENNEQLAGQWIRALAAANRVGQVPAFYREFTQRLLDDLGVRPSSELAQIFNEVTNPSRPAPSATNRAGTPRVTPYFTGRADLLHRLDGLLLGEDRGADVVALDGPPGVGKTTLAKHWARRRRDQFSDGILFADLAGYSNTPLVQPHTVMMSFLEELDVHPSQIPDDTTERANLLRRTLSTRQVLVILDNVRDSAHVRPLLAAIPRPTLITSRRRLTGIVYREAVRAVAVPALPQQDSADLLDKHLGGRVAESPVAIARLIDLCQGLPLALWIAGEHIAARPQAPIDELAEDLAHTRRLLDAGSHGDDDTTTLRSTFSWSYHALRADERRIFDLIGLHPGTRFGIQAVSALAGDDTDNVERLLDSLVGAHLVTQERSNRYLVHDLLHAYATAIPHEPAETFSQATRRMLDWYLATARHARVHLVGDDHDVPELELADAVEPMNFDGPNPALQWLVSERANLVACTYRAANLGYHEHVWRFSACLHPLSHYEAPQDLVEIHELGRQAAEHLGHTAAAGGCLNNKGFVFALLNDHASAGLCFEMAYEAFTQADDTRGLAVTVHNTGVTYLNLNRPAEAITWLTRGLGLNTRIGSEWGIANSHRRLGDAHTELDQLADAQEHYRQASYASQRAHDPAGHGTALSCLANLALKRNHIAEAIRYGEAALDELDRAQVNRGGTAMVLLTLATAYLAENSLTKANSMAYEAVNTYRDTQNVSGEIDALVLLGRTLAATGETTRAATAWTDATVLLSSPTDPRASVLSELLTTSASLPVPPPRSVAQADKASSRNKVTGVTDPQASR
ncbi:MAG: BTAD domain-containing putative transcriptional regulator [Actinophytocola sp.]|uniref:BTAD domain-containing putative transcriptional regulator n=1 Tax=Actinophytocola sp. TaxID=1872138 RepID=UPI003C719E03